MKRSHKLFTSNGLRRFRQLARRLERALRSQTQNGPSVKVRKLQTELSLLAKKLNLFGGPRIAATLAGLLLAGTGNALAQPKVSDLAPATNATNIALDSDISIDFSQQMSSASITAANIHIHSYMRGLLSTRGSFSGNPQRLFNPDADFLPNELIAVTVTNAQATSGTALAAPLVYNFRATSGTRAAVEFTELKTVNQSSFDVDLADFNGDGILDAILSNFFDPSRLLIGNGDGTFDVSSFGPDVQTSNAVTGDFDGDGDVDYIMARTSTVNDIWLNDGTGTFSSSTLGHGGLPSGPKAGDLDGDGDLDVVFGGSGTRRETLWLNNGDATFASSTFGDKRNSQEVAIGDLDNDGDLDIIVAGYDANALHLNNGDASFASMTFGGRNSLGVELGDLDGDQDLDFIVSNNANGNSQLYINNGDATFASSDLGFNFNSARVGDLDGDGDLDFVSFDEGVERIFINDGTATFTHSSFGGENSTTGALADLNNDGTLDIFVAHYLNTNSSIWLNRPVAPVITSLTPSSTTASLNSFSVEVLGSNFESTQANLSYVSASGATLGSRSLSILSATTTSLTLEFPLRSAATVATLQLEISNSSGSTLTAFTVNNDQPTIQAGAPSVTLPENTSTTISLAIGDVWPGLGALQIIPPATDGSSIASITQIGATAATTQFQVSGAVNFSGNTSLEFVVDDGSLTASTSVNVIITGVDDPPTLQLSTSAISIWQNGIGKFSLQVNDPDTPEHLLVISATSANQSILADDNIKRVEYSVNPMFFFTSNCYSAGETEIFVRVSDGSSATVQTIQLNILAGSEAPITSSTSACIGSTVQYSALPATTGATLQWSVNGGTIVSSATGNSVQVAWGASSARDIMLTRTYPNTCVSTASLDLSAEYVSASADLVTLVGASSVTIAVLFNDSGSGLSLSSFTPPNDGSAVQQGNQIVYTPDSGFTGTDSFTYSIEGSNGCSSTAIVTVTVGTNTERLNILFVQQLKNRRAGIRGLNGVEGAVVSQDGKHVYAAGAQDHSIVLFDRDANFGRLTYKERVRNLRGGVSGIKNVNSVVLSANQDRLFALGYGNNSLVLFDRDTTTGKLSFLDKRTNGQLDGGKLIDALSRPRALALSPDGKNVYVASYGNSSLGVLQFDGSIDELSWLEKQRDGQAGVDGLRAILDVIVSLDGKHVYAAGSGDDAIAIFSRDSLDGSLTFLKRIRDGIAGVDGLAQVSALAFSPNGTYLYAAGSGDDAVVMFKRNATDGSLTFIKQWADGRNGVSGLDGVSALATSSAGQLWTASPADRAATVFSILADGKLRFEGVNNTNVGDARFVALSQDGNYAYVPDKRRDALNVLFRNQQPRAVDDNGLQVSPHGSLDIAVLNNDFDADGDNISINSKTDGSSGTVEILGGGSSLRYNAGSAGTDQFTYTIDDSHGGTSTATVRIQIVQPKNSYSASVEEVKQDGIQGIRVSPNPLRQELTLRYMLREAGRLHLHLFDMRGFEIGTYDAGRQPSGAGILNWNLTELRLAAGAYTLILKGDGIEEMLVPLRIVD